MHYRYALKIESPGILVAAHQRAAQWYEDNGLILDAIHHAFLADDYEHAAHLLEFVWAELDLSYHAGPWFKWAKRLPQEMILAHPLLCLGVAWSLVSEGDFTGGEPYLEAAETYVNRYLNSDEDHGSCTLAYGSCRSALSTGLHRIGAS